MPKIRKQAVLIEKPAVRCRNCGYVWTPDARRWRNVNHAMIYGKPMKTIHCPACGVRIYLRIETAKEIIEWWSMHEDNVSLPRRFR